MSIRSRALRLLGRKTETTYLFNERARTVTGPYMDEVSGLVTVPNGAVTNAAESIGSATRRYLQFSNDPDADICLQSTLANPLDIAGSGYTEFAIEMWVKILSNPGTNPYWASIMTSSTDLMRLRWHGASVLKPWWTVYDEDGDPFALFTQWDRQNTVNQWEHMMMWCDGSDLYGAFATGSPVSVSWSGKSLGETGTKYLRLAAGFNSAELNANIRIAGMRMWLGSNGLTDASNRATLNNSGNGPVAMASLPSALLTNLAYSLTPSQTSATRAAETGSWIGLNTDVSFGGRQIIDVPRNSATYYTFNGAADFRMESSVRSVATDASNYTIAGLVFRRSDANNLWRVEVDAQADEIRLVKVDSGTPTTVSTAPTTLSDNEEVTLRIDALSSDMMIRVNGVPLISQSNQTFNSTETVCGLYHLSTGSPVHPVIGSGDGYVTFGPISLRETGISVGFLSHPTIVASTQGGNGDGSPSSPMSLQQAINAASASNTHKVIELLENAATPEDFSSLSGGPTAISITSLTQTAGSATATAAGHGLATNDLVSVQAAADSWFNGSFRVTGWSGNDFTYSVDSLAGATAGGTPTAARMVEIRPYMADEIVIDHYDINGPSAFDVSDLQYIAFHDLHVLNSGWQTRWVTDHSVYAEEPQRPSISTLDGLGCSYYRCTWQDTANVGFWVNTQSAEMVECTIINQGVEDVSRGHDHGPYTQNEDPHRREFRHFVSVPGFGNNFTIWGEGGPVTNYLVKQSVGMGERIQIGGATQPLINCHIRETHFWGSNSSSASVNGNVMSVNFGYTHPDDVDITIDQCVLDHAGSWQINTVETVELTDNIIFYRDKQFGAVNIYAPRIFDSGTVVTGASTSLTLEAAASATNDIYNGMKIAIGASGGLGNAGGQQSTVTAYNGTTKVATMSPAWTIVPDSNCEYFIIEESLTSSGNSFITEQASYSSSSFFNLNGVIWSSYNTNNPGLDFWLDYSGSTTDTLSLGTTPADAVHVFPSTMVQNSRWRFNHALVVIYNYTLASNVTVDLSGVSTLVDDTEYTLVNALHPDESTTFTYLTATQQVVVGMGEWSRKEPLGWNASDGHIQNLSWYDPYPEKGVFWIRESV